MDVHVNNFTSVLEQVLSHEMVRPVIESLRPTVGDFFDEAGNRRVSTIDSIEDLDPNNVALENGRAGAGGDSSPLKTSGISVDK